MYCLIPVLLSILLIIAFSLTDYRQKLVWMALLLTGSDVICLASPSESHFRELYLMSLTLGMAFFKARAQAYFSLKFMFDVVEQHLPPIHCYANDPQLHISFSPKVHSAQTGAVASIKHCIQDIRQ